MRYFLVMLLILLVSSLSHCLECTETATEVILGDQAGLLGIVLMLTAVLISLAYMGGKLTGNPKMLVFAKDELYHLGFSLVIIIGFSGLLLLSCQILGFFFESAFEQIGEDSPCYSDESTVSGVSTCFLNRAKSDAEHMANRYVSGYINNMMWSTLSMSIAIPLFDTYTAVIASYKRVVSSQYNTILNMFIIPALVSMSIQQLLLGFVNNNIIAWIVPSGLILRVLPPTRMMGNMILALAIGIYILVPFFYTFNLLMVDATFNAGDCEREVSAEFGPGQLKFYDAICDNVADGYSCWSYEGSGSNRSSTCDNPYGFWMLARFVPLAFLLPNLMIALIVAFIGSLAKAFRVIG
jgi:hypothetical protein